MPASQDWMEEARLRLADARLLLDRGRSSRAISSAYYALHATGKGALLSIGVEIDTHTGLYKQLSKHLCVMAGWRTVRLRSSGIYTRNAWRQTTT